VPGQAGPGAPGAGEHDAAGRAGCDGARRCGHGIEELRGAALGVRHPQALPALRQGTLVCSCVRVYRCVGRTYSLLSEPRSIACTCFPFWSGLAAPLFFWFHAERLLFGKHPRVIRLIMMHRSVMHRPKAETSNQAPRFFPLPSALREFTGSHVAGQRCGGSRRDQSAQP